jgi:hypothetical protein
VFGCFFGAFEFIRFTLMVYQAIIIPPTWRARALISGCPSPRRAALTAVLHLFVGRLILASSLSSGEPASIHVPSVVVWNMRDIEPGYRDRVLTLERI